MLQCCAFAVSTPKINQSINQRFIRVKQFNRNVSKSDFCFFFLFIIFSVSPSLPLHLPSGISLLSPFVIHSLFFSLLFLLLLLLLLLRFLIPLTQRRSISPTAKRIPAGIFFSSSSSSSSSIPLLSFFCCASSFFFYYLFRKE